MSESSMMKVATGLAIGTEADPNLAAQAVLQAMQALDITIASSVLLIITSEFASDPLPAIKAAAKAASCVQVMGCSAPGIFTDQDWVLDAPAVAAMVFSGDISLQAIANPLPDQLLLALTAPNAINTNWLSAPGMRFGGVSGDALGQGPFSVWQNAKGTVTGQCEAAMTGVRGAVKATHGLRYLTEPQTVTQVDGHNLQSLAGKPALKSLVNVCMSHESLPVHLLMAVYADSLEILEDGDYHLSTLLYGNEGEGSVTLSKRLQVGQHMRWAMRDVDAAQADLKETAQQLSRQLQSIPDFGLLFSCMGRGPYFYGGVDRDLILLKQQFPNMPLIGFYGNGEIAPIHGVSELLQYSAVLALFAQDTELRLAQDEGAEFEEPEIEPQLKFSEAEQ